MRSILLVIVALAACSKTENVVTRGSCQTSPSVCEDYESTDAKYIERQKGACKGLGTWTEAACNVANLAGSCRETHGWTRTRHYYTGIEGQPNTDAAKAKVECGAYGTWIEPAKP